MEAMSSNETWEVLPLPRGAKPLRVMWVFSLKGVGASEQLRFKARLVAKGCSQRPGLDFGEVYAPVGRAQTIRSLLALAAIRDLEVHQDFTTAFLNGEQGEEVWVEQPVGYEQGGANSGLFCRLRKALYGLKQAPRAWHSTLAAALEQFGFVEGEADPGLWFRGEGEHRVWVVVYVDDLLIAGELSKVQRVKQELLGQFQGKDMGEVGVFVGLKIERDRDARTLHISQPAHAQQLVEKVGLTAAKGRDLPISTADQVTAAGTGLDEKGQALYREVVGSLLYLSTHTRPDLAHVTGVLSRYMANPTAEQWTVAKGAVRYLRGTSSMGINYGGENAGRGLEGYVDSDFAGDKEDRKSTSGMVFMLGGGAVSWGSKKQSTVSCSTTEAEYIAAAGGVREAMWFQKLGRDLLGWGETRLPPTVSIDSSTSSRGSSRNFPSCTPTVPQPSASSTTTWCPDGPSTLTLTIM